ncbi:Uncharacterised protein [uncultured archaeon]|nr:Uncharacterised protein [uncultured archaeon]
MKEKLWITMFAVMVMTQIAVAGLGDINDPSQGIAINEFLWNVINLIRFIAAAVCVLALSWAGLVMIFGLFGGTENHARAKEIAGAAILGLILVVLAPSIVNWIVNGIH